MEIVSYKINDEGVARVIKIHARYVDDIHPEEAMAELDRVYDELTKTPAIWRAPPSRHGRMYAPNIHRNCMIMHDPRLENSFIGYRVKDGLIIGGNSILFQCSDCQTFWGKKTRNGRTPHRCDPCQEHYFKSRNRRYRQKAATKA